MKPARKPFSSHSATILSTLLLLTVISPGTAQTIPATGSWTPIVETNTPRPDYSQLKYWMMAAQNPTAPVDVLFIHTTTFKDTNYVNPVTGGWLSTPLDPAKPQVWNQTIADAIQESNATAVTRTQASVFAACCNIYAPFYRQAALPEVLTADPASAERALSVAYSDVEDAFDYYMAHLNHGRPFILAGHSQGANLALWLLEKRLNNPEYLHRLVAAYIIGWSVTQNELDQYPHLEMCNTATQTRSLLSKTM